jgi:PBSX family phage portal protein
MTATQTRKATTRAPAKAQAFTFGEPEAVLDKRELFDLFEVYHNGKWYEPPISRVALGKTYRMNPHHQSAILLKRNLLGGAFVPSRWLSRQEFSAWALDWLIFGDAYLERIPNMAGRPMELRRSMAAYTRVGRIKDEYWFVRPGLSIGDAHRFEQGAIHHLMEHDPLQEVYGMPEYLCALHSGLLNEAATIFRRKYFKNGSHMGYILLNTSEHISATDSDAIREAMRQSKGAGNFRNMYVHAPKGGKDSLQILPIGEVAAKDEFMGIKDITSQDVLVAHRTPPILVSMIPKNVGGFGNVVDAGRTFYELEILPIQRRMLEVNDWLGLEAVRFESLSDQGILERVVATPQNSPAR